MVRKSVGSALNSARRLWEAARQGPGAQPDDAEAVIARLRDKAARAHLSEELNALQHDRVRGQFHVVVFGAASAGKTSLVNALAGRCRGATSPINGTTPRGVRRTEELDGPDGAVLLTDTPGIACAGAEGALDEAEAIELAAKADLVLFVADQDLHRFEHATLSLLVRNGKRTLVVLNKKDRFAEPELREVSQKLRERLAGLVAPDDIVTVAAAPRPVPVRVRSADGTEATVIEYEAPDLAGLEARIAQIVAGEGGALRAANLLLRGYLLDKQANDALARQRRDDASAIIERYQWLAAKTVIAVPIPEVDMLAAGAVEYRMIAELGALFGVTLSLAHVQMISDQMIRTVIRRRLVEAATTWIAGLFKSTLVGYAAGGLVQAVTIAYLTHVTGHAFYHYFDRGQDWGDGGMSGAVARQFESTKRTAFLKEFAGQLFDRLDRRVGRP